MDSGNSIPILDFVLGKLISHITTDSPLKKDLREIYNNMSFMNALLKDAQVKQLIRDWLMEVKDLAYDVEDVLDEVLLQESQQVSHFKQILFRRKIGKMISQLRQRSAHIIRNALRFNLTQTAKVPEIADEDLHQPRASPFLTSEPKIYGRDEDKKAISHLLLHSLSDLCICSIVGMGGLGKTTLARLLYNDEEIQNHFDARIWVCIYEDFVIKRIIKLIIESLVQKKCDLEDTDPLKNLLKNLLNGRKYLLVLDDVWDSNMENWNNLVHFLLSCGCPGSSIIVTTRLQKVAECVTSLRTSPATTTTSTYNLGPLLDESWSLFEECAFGVIDEEDEYLIEIGKAVVAKCGGLPLAIKAMGSLLNGKTERFWKHVRDSDSWHLEEDYGDTKILPALRVSYDHLPSIFRECFAYCAVYPKGWILNKERLIYQWMANGIIRSAKKMEEEEIGDMVFNRLLQLSFFEDIHEDKYERITQCKMHSLVHELACSVMKFECSRMKIGEMWNMYRVHHLSVTCNSPYSPNTLHTLSKYQLSLHTLMFIVIQRSNVFGLDIFLSHLSRLKRLRVLELGALWSVKRLPPWIGHLKILRYLQLENTGITLLPDFVCNLQLLQVLLLGRNVGLTSLPSSIGNLKRLRYLDLSYTGIKVFPESVGNLTDLQTLKLLFCAKLEMLPREMKNMKSLRNLIIGWEANKLLIQSMPVGISKLSHLEKLELFVVSKNSIGERRRLNRLNQLTRSLSIAASSSGEGGAGIQELGSFEQLKGSLTIENIRHVHDPTDARGARLENKERLSDLYLHWGVDDSEGEDNEEEKKKSQRVLEFLKPHPNIQVLKIRDYPGAEFPSWVENCALTLPNLHTLELSRMPNAAHHLHQLPPNLKILWIWESPKLRLPPATVLPSSIEELAVSASNDPVLSYVEALPKLSKLRIGRFSEDETLPEAPLKNLTCLCDLQISSCSKLKRLPTTLANIAKTLTKLELFRCPELEFVTEEEFKRLTSLEILQIASCGGLTSLPNSSLRHLRKLKELYLVDCPKLEMTAVGFRHLVSLKVLQFRLLPQLTLLPDGMRHVTTLQCLSIEECKNLQRLPGWLQQHLSPALHHLEIRKCHPELHRRCKIDKSEVWHKISHLKVVNAE